MSSIGVQKAHCGKWGKMEQGFQCTLQITTLFSVFLYFIGFLTHIYPYLKNIYHIVIILVSNMEKISGPKRFRPKATLIVGLHLESHLLDALQRRERSKPRFTSLQLNKMDCFQIIWICVKQAGQSTQWTRSSSHEWRKEKGRWKWNEKR